MVAAGGGEKENVGPSREGLHRCREERSLTHGLQSRDVSGTSDALDDARGDDLRAAEQDRAGPCRLGGPAVPVTATAEGHHRGRHLKD